MKRTYPANIDGQIFYIDEDAYLMLQDYLRQLKETFHGEEGAEIAGDIESRIREHFDERISSGANVIVIDDVRRVIETMGRPEEITGEEEIEEETVPPKVETETEESKKDDDGTLFSFSISSNKFKRKKAPENNPKRKRFYRSTKNKVFGGVLGGLAAYLGWDANIMRLLAIVLTVCTYFWPCIIIYLILWMVIPAANTPRRMLEMRGDPVNLDTVGQTVIANNPAIPPVDADEGNSLPTLSSVFSILGKVLMGFLGIIGGIASAGCLIAFLVMGVCLTLFLGWDIVTAPFHSGLGITMVSCIMIWLLVGFIAFGSLLWAACCVLFNSAGASRNTKITIVVMEVILITIGIALALVANTF